MLHLVTLNFIIASKDTFGKNESETQSRIRREALWKERKKAISTKSKAIDLVRTPNSYKEEKTHKTP